MLKRGFCKGWTNLIMNCVCTVDPFSPYLFLMVSDVLSWFIQRAVDHGEINGIQMNRHGPGMSQFFLRITLSFSSKLIGRVVKIYWISSISIVGHWVKWSVSRNPVYILARMFLLTYGPTSVESLGCHRFRTQGRTWDFRLYGEDWNVKALPMLKGKCLGRYKDGMRHLSHLRRMKF